MDKRYIQYGIINIIGSNRVAPIIKKYCNKGLLNRHFSVSFLQNLTDDHFFPQSVLFRERGLEILVGFTN